ALEIHEAITSDADIAVVKERILKDQALASEILRMANSALFSG
ncbi:MAG: HD-like signal output (HDOD) protein, partial [Candidatus Azotimanducaceae bacterium]